MSSSTSSRRSGTRRPGAAPKPTSAASGTLPASARAARAAAQERRITASRASGKWPARWWRLPEPPPVKRSYHRERWTDKQNDILEKYYTTHGAAYTAALLGRSIVAIRARARMFRLQGFETDIWSGAETRRAVALFTKLGARPGTIEKIAREMGRTTGSVAGHLRRRGLRVKEQREWTAREEKILLKYYGIETVGQIGDRIDRTADAVMRRANLLGLRWRVSPPWTPEDDARLRKLHARHGHDWAPIAVALGRFKVDVKQRATRLGLRRTVREWTPREDRLLRKLQPTTPYRELPRHFDRTIGAIRARIHQLGLGEEAARSWTPEEDAKLRKLFGTMPASKLAARFGRTGPAVSLRAAKLGLAAEAPRRWSGKDLELLAKLRRAGKSYEEIAGRLGRSVDAVHVRANKMKLNARG